MQVVWSASWLSNYDSLLRKWQLKKKFTSDSKSCRNQDLLLIRSYLVSATVDQRKKIPLCILTLEKFDTVQLWKLILQSECLIKISGIFGAHWSFWNSKAALVLWRSFLLLQLAFYSPIHCFSSLDDSIPRLYESQWTVQSCCHVSSLYFKL